MICILVCMLQQISLSDEEQGPARLPELHVKRFVGEQLGEGGGNHAGSC